MVTTAGRSTLLPLSAALVAVAVAVSACQQGSKPQSQQSPSPTQASSTSQSASSTAPTTSSTPQSTTAQAESTIVLEVTGSGDVYAIWSDPFGNLASDHATIPFLKSFPLPADVKSVSLNWTSRDDIPKGCKISVDNNVVVEQAPGTADHCVFQR